MEFADSLFPLLRFLGLPIPRFQSSVVIQLRHKFELVFVEEAFDQHDRNFLAWIAFLIRVLKDANFIPLANMKDDLLKGNVSLGLQLLVLAGIPIIMFHALMMT